MLGLFIFLFGLAVGSFLNVCIYRIPRGESVVLPPSHCPQCDRRLAAGDLIPILSYVFLKGRCRSCQGRISPRYPLIEFFSGLLFWAAYLFIGPVPALINYFILLATLMVVTLIDLDHAIIPDKVLAWGAALHLVANVFTRQISWPEAGLGFLAGGLLLLAIAVVSRGGMGGGDIKLTAVLGLFLGWQRVLIAFVLASLIGALAGLTLVVMKRKTLKEAVPFGPFLAAAALVMLFWGDALINGYFGLFR